MNYSFETTSDLVRAVQSLMFSDPDIEAAYLALNEVNPTATEDLSVRVMRFGIDFGSVSRNAEIKEKITEASIKGFWVGAATAVCAIAANAGVYYYLKNKRSVKE